MLFVVLALLGVILFEEGLLGTTLGVAEGVGGGGGASFRVADISNPYPLIIV